MSNILNLLEKYQKYCSISIVIFSWCKVCLVIKQINNYNSSLPVNKQLFLGHIQKYIHQSKAFTDN